MAYGNYFPAGYQPQYMYQPQPQQTQTQQTQTGIIWVQGEAGAKSYLVAPNTTVQLWDSESQSIYLKSADASGMPSMKILDYTIRDNSIPTPQNTPQPNTDYVTKDEFNNFKQEVQKMIGGKNNESTVPTDKQHNKPNRQ